MTDNAAQFETEVVAHQHALLDAVATVGMSPNSVEALDFEGTSVPRARVRWPSYFCTRGGYVRVLAYLLQNNLPFDLEVSAPDGASGRYQLYPPLDPDTQHLLATIDPRQASLLAEMQSRVERVFEQLRRAGVEASSAQPEGPPFDIP